MSSSESSEEAVEVVLEVQSIESSEELPKEQWSSLICMQIPEKIKNEVKSEGSGEICAKYLTSSDSSVLRHPYYSYPALLDPGIEEALLEPEEKIVYDSDGRDLYLALCEEMNQAPVMMFHRKLLNPIIDLKYYCVDPKGVRALAMALKYNTYVKYFGLTDNFLNVDACFHLGDMLLANFTLTELNLEGCRIGPEGAKRIFKSLEVNRTLQTINLSRCQIGDVGGQYFAESISTGLNIKRVFLSYNQLSGKTAVALAEAIEFQNTLVQLDLSWNNFYGPMGIILFLNRLAENDKFEDLNLSWNNIGDMRIINGIKNLLRAPNLNTLNLSNNKIQGEALEGILSELTKAKKLTTFDISSNPLTPEDALKVINKLKLRNCKIQNLHLDNIIVNNQFLLVLNKIKSSKAKKGTIVTFGAVGETSKAQGPNLKELVLNRANFLGNNSKRTKANVGLIFLQICKENKKLNTTVMDHRDFEESVRAAGAPMLDSNLIEEIVNAFSGPKKKKCKTIDLAKLVDYISRKWPDAKLPATPPPKPKPEPEPDPEVPAPPPTKGKTGAPDKGKKK